MSSTKKYIRTETDQIIDYENLPAFNKSWIEARADHYIVKQADTIPELCDVVYVLDGKHKVPTWTIDSPQDIKDISSLGTALQKRVKAGTYTIMYGIWVEVKPGIFNVHAVAVMNKEGKVVLTDDNEED